ncbi:hypothetical protein FA15DRAFT_740498 [Coprinopsis marcescibilis]|uniref:Integrase core domain-containing protein n=1 Tax=Coprinopsis marcescibilis TaxID=230819 RepID=A0A5C3K9N8_COPMA|nr:hypothetical protein FA15DRAFT_740498 [Coprinopsis marcescibilis]
MPPQRGKGKNQNKPNPPLQTIAPWIRMYFAQHKNDRQILDTLLLHHIDTEVYGLGYTKFRQMRQQLGLNGARQEGLTLERAKNNLDTLRHVYPGAGRDEMISLYLFEYRAKIPRSIVVRYFRTYEPEAFELRRHKRFVRHRFWSAGTNALWCVDQHDKWKVTWGLCLHLCVDPFSGYLLWLRVWWNNSNPRLICHYYLQTIEALGKMPLITQSDPGTENTRLANATTFLRRWHDPQLPTGTIQHQWKREKQNVKPEIEWSQLRRRFSQGFEAILEFGVREGWYDSLNSIHVLTFRWVFIPWMQLELDGYTNRVNNKRKRKNNKKLTPQGVPLDLFERPEDVGARNYAVSIVYQPKANRYLTAPLDYGRPHCNPGCQKGICPRQSSRDVSGTTIL